MKKLLVPSLLFAHIVCFGQIDFNKHHISLEKPQFITPFSEPDFQVQLIHLEAPSPDGDSYRSFLMRQKQAQRKKHPLHAENEIQNKSNTSQPNVKDGTRMFRVIGGNVRDVIGGIPNDNTLAVSNDGMVICAINSTVWAYNSNTDTTHFPTHSSSLKNFGGGGVTDNNFDPKIMYDPSADRWILVYLQNTSPSNSRIKVCFSTTNDPLDPWNAYTLPGNPLNNNRWSDFPAITITEKEVFLTLNLIIPDVSWQVGFDGSIIWQMNKEDGYTGAGDLQNTLWTDIKYGGNFIRNLHPVWGAEGIAAEAFFLSNRNFDLSNDSVFVLHLQGEHDDPSALIDIKIAKADLPYGVPPNGRQFDTDLNDPTKGLQTNDARVLGAITNGEWIQYVANTVVPSTGFSGIYHGFITDINSAPSVHGQLISHPTQDFGYPNIAWTGDEPCDIETIIGFNYTSPVDFPGVASVYYDNEGNYSQPLVLKEGENYTDRHSDSYERWGDYFGMQRKFNEPKTVWLSGYFGNELKQNTTWVAEVASPDTNHLYLNMELSGSPSLCEGTYTAAITGGLPPFRYNFNGSGFSSIDYLSGICAGDSIIITIEDDRGCAQTDTLIAPKTAIDGSSAVFPNPTTDISVVRFKLDSPQRLEAALFDDAGRLMTVLYDNDAKAGENELQFNLTPLRHGVYLLRLKGDGGFLLKQRIIKVKH